MRILAITNLYPNPLQPTRGVFNCNQFEALGRDHSVVVISPISWTTELVRRLRGNCDLQKGRIRKTNGIKVYHPRYFYPPKMLRKYYGYCFAASIQRLFYRIMNEFEPELVLGAWAYPDGWTACSLAQKARIPAVIKVHGSDVLLARRNPGSLGPTAWALRKADAVIAVSEDLARRVIDLGADPHRVRVVYDGIDETVFCPGDQGDAKKRLGLGSDPMVLFVGNLVPVKGIGVLLQACSQLINQGVHLTCQIIGDGPLRQDCARYIREHNLQDRIRLNGSHPHHQLPDWFRAANAFVLPSFSEGVPNVLLEAIACGTPFVASRVGGIPEIAHLGRNQLVPPGNAKVLAEAIRSILTNPSALTPFPNVPMRSHAQGASELVEVFEKVLKSRRPVKPLLALSAS